MQAYSILYTQGDQFDSEVGLDEYRLWEARDDMSTLWPWPDACGFVTKEESPEGRLEMTGCNDSVRLVWNDYLDSISVVRGWEGRTDTGLRIGSSLDEFLGAYPDAISEGEDVFSANGQFRVYVGASGNIEEMEVYATP